jgi:hypothetical protein
MQCTLKLTILFVVVVGRNSGLVVEKRSAEAGFD